MIEYRQMAEKLGKARKTMKEMAEKCPNFVCSKREPFYDGADGISYICGITGEQINQYDCEECEMYKDYSLMKQHLADQAKKESDPESKQSDAVNAPAHYCGQIECIDYLRDKLTKEEFIGFCMGNVLKYSSRWRKKDGLQDLKKAAVYLGWAIENEEKHA